MTWKKQPTRPTTNWRNYLGSGASRDAHQYSCLTKFYSVNRSHNEMTLLCVGISGGSCTCNALCVSAVQAWWPEVNTQFTDSFSARANLSDLVAEKMMLLLVIFSKQRIWPFSFCLSIIAIIKSRNPKCFPYLGCNLWPSLWVDVGLEQCLLKVIFDKLVQRVSPDCWIH